MYKKNYCIITKSKAKKLCILKEIFGRSILSYRFTPVLNKRIMSRKNEKLYELLTFEISE